MSQLRFADYFKGFVAFQEAFCYFAYDWSDYSHQDHFSNIMAMRLLIAHSVRW
ncbi:MAG: hypothetical protein HYR76_03090 [Ignavibacteria bacterium]|nr:hypothetical protein [Ignavibacteria bacterium]MBI3765930.1 hypothetical protein [Ignavibacteriales bacterium]